MLTLKPSNMLVYFGRCGKGILLRPNRHLQLGRNLYVTSVTASDKYWRVNFRDNGRYKHLLVPNSGNGTCPQLLPCRNVSRETLYTDYGHKRRPFFTRRRMFTLSAIFTTALVILYIENSR